MSDTKHGWVTPRADGARARCGGPGVCATCDTEAMHEAMLTGVFGVVPTAPNERPLPTSIEGRDPIVHAVASLAAAVSLLERTPKAKNAAASNAMFDQMLKDYRVALDNARAALASAPVADVRECGNADCGWRGTTERMCGSVGPLCPECGETTEASAPVAGEAQRLVAIPAQHSGVVLSMDGATLHMQRDGSGQIIIAEEDFTLEDDRDEGPEGPQGSVHWVTRLLASELIALRDFLTGHARPSDDSLWDQTLTERDEYHDIADKLANAIADHLLVEIGEHGSSNCPWMRALEAIENAAPQASEAAPFAPDWVNYRQGVANGKAEALEEAARVAESTVAGDSKPDNPYRIGTAKQAAARIRALMTPADQASEADGQWRELALKFDAQRMVFRDLLKAAVPLLIGPEDFKERIEKALASSPGECLKASEAVPVGIINAARHAGFSFLRRADGSYTLQPIVMATPQADKDGGDCAKGAVVPSEPLRVFSAGMWTYDGTGQAFSHTELDAAAFVTYRAALSAQPGAQKKGGGHEN